MADAVKTTIGGAVTTVTDALKKAPAKKAVKKAVTKKAAKRHLQKRLLKRLQLEGREEILKEACQKAARRLPHQRSTR